MGHSEVQTLVKVREEHAGLRQRLADAGVVLAEAAARIEGARQEVRPAIAEMLERLKEDIEGQPQVSLVRRGTVALHNVIISLRHGGAIPQRVLLEEINAAREALEAMLRDPAFGLPEQELLAGAYRALSARGIERPMCGHQSFKLELFTQVLKPYPTDPLASIFEVPVAALTCHECGNMSMHRLDELGVVSRALDS